MDAEGERLPHCQPDAERVLAALSRAARHARRQPSAPVPIWTLLEHLRLRRRGRPARAVHAALAELERGGLAERAKRHGVAVWEASAAGQARLVELARAGRSPELPESPQHREWRRARMLAGDEIGRLRDELRQALLDGGRALAAHPAPPSDEWFVLAARLHDACRHFGSAAYVLGEWREPDDARADIDDLAGEVDAALDASALARRRALRTGRRNTRLWRDDGA
jgi:hypothetical protein